LEINQVGGRRFAKSLLELNLPPLRFRRVGGPALYARWLRPALFGGALVSDAPSLERRWHYTAGMQIDLRLISLSLLKTTLSFGAAAAWDDDFNRNEELMISLKIF
jgi:predicted exporter